MYEIDARKAVHFCDTLSRRGFLHAGAVATLGLTMPNFFAAKAHGAVKKDDRNCIFLFLVGGPSQLDTFDMKPDAPSEIRGPYKPIATNSPDIQISEIFPRVARHADKFSIVRSMHHPGLSCGDACHHTLQTGCVFSDGHEAPPDYISSVRIDPSRKLRDLVDDSVRRLENRRDARLDDDSFHQAYTLMSSSTTRDAFDLSKEPDRLRERYGWNKFGQGCLISRRLIERGVRFSTVNMFESVMHEITWDIHGCAPFSPIECYRDHVGPMFDRAYSALLEDLNDRGLLESTLVVATGEFGRTPRINPAGGRDHWPHAWSALLAGGGVQGGRVVGATDKNGAYPVDRPVTPAELAATIYHSLGIDAGAHLPNTSAGVHPIHELF